MLVRPSRLLRKRKQERSKIVVNITPPLSQAPVPAPVERPKFVPWG